MSLILRLLSDLAFTILYCNKDVIHMTFSQPDSINIDLLLTNFANAFLKS